MYEINAKDLTSVGAGVQVTTVIPDWIAPKVDAQIDPRWRDRILITPPILPIGEWPFPRVFGELPLSL